MAKPEVIDRPSGGLLGRHRLRCLSGFGRDLGRSHIRLRLRGRGGLLHKWLLALGCGGARSLRGRGGNRVFLETDATFESLDTTDEALRSQIRLGRRTARERHLEEQAVVRRVAHLGDRLAYELEQAEQAAD